MTPGIKPPPKDAGGRKAGRLPRRVLDKWHRPACYRIYSAGGDYLAEMIRQQAGDTWRGLAAADEAMSQDDD